MKIKRNEFKEVIDSLLPAISKKDLVAQMSRIIFRDDIAGTFNDQIAISYPVDLNGIDCSVPAEDLAKILSGINEEEIGIEVAEGKMIITSTSTVAEISTVSESKAVEEFYNSLNLGSMDWKPLPDNFVEKINLAKFSTSANTYDPQNLFCVAIEKDYIYSGDGYRCSKIKCPTGMTERILVPHSSISSIVKFTDIVDYAIASGWIHFATSEDTVISSRIVKGEYPNVTKILSQFKGGEKIKIGKELIPVLNNVDNLLASSADFLRYVKIGIKKGKTTITGKKEGLTIQKSVKNDFKKDIVEFEISPSFLSSLLYLDITNTIQIADHLAFFEGKGFQHLVTLPFE